MRYSSRSQKLIRNIFLRSMVCGALIGATLLALGSPAIVFAADENERFKNTEIRVIRPKYFNKRGRFELGGQLSGIMNETFIYTFLLSGIATYHFTESFALELSGSFGLNIDKEDKRILFDEFEIKTKIFRTMYAAEGSLQWTPIYGKWQLGSGRLVYFDTFIALGGGMTGINWKYSDFCTEPTKNVAGSTAEPATIPADVVKTYPTFLAGIGQRYFISKTTAVKWDIRNHVLFYDKLDAECDPRLGESGSANHQNVTLQIGASKFF